MTSPIERFKDAYYNWRYNPFSEVDMAVDKVEDGLIIPPGSPFIIQLLEQARYNDPASVAVRCYGVDTTVDETSADGQPVLKVAATAGFSEADTVIINRGGDREEEKVVDSIQAGVSLTMTENLEFEHTAGQADAVEKYIAFTHTAGAPAQSQFRVDYPPDDGGKGTGLIEFNTNDANKEVRITYKATGSPALAETLDTKISYPASIPADNQIVGFSSGVPYWLRLPHANLASVTANQHHAQAHTLASHSSKAHSELTGISANQHHAQSHSHGSHSGIGANDHHAQSHTLNSHSNFGTYINQALLTSSSPTFEVVHAMNKVRLYDLGRDHYLSLKVNENLSASRNLNIIVGSAERQITLTGNPTLADWFNQNVKSSASPSFAHLTLTHAESKLQGGAKLFLEAGVNGIGSDTIYNDTTVTAPNMTIFAAPAGRIRRDTSALKYKDKVKNLELDSSLIHKLRPVSFNSLCGDDDKKKRFIGLIAEDIERILPEVVVYNKDNKVESYDHKMLLTLMLAEIQKLNARIKELEN